MSAFGFMVIGIVSLCCSAACLIAAVVVHARSHVRRTGSAPASRRHGRKGKVRTLRQVGRQKAPRLTGSSRQAEAGPGPACGETGAGYRPLVREAPVAHQGRWTEAGDDPPSAGRTVPPGAPYLERATELLCGEEATQFLEDEEEPWRVLDEL